MATQIPKTGKKSPTSLKWDTIESFRQHSSPFSEEDRYRGEYDFEPQEQVPPKRKKEANLFNYQAYYEKEVVKREIKELTNQVKLELDRLRKTELKFLSEVKDVEHVAINSPTEKPGVYHIRFLELVLGILKTLQLKINESRTWLQALVTKKKKRGSLFAALSRKKGTQYSLSQEITSARSVQ